MRKKTLRTICAVVVIGVALGVASRMRNLHERSKMRISVEKGASDISGLAGQKKTLGVSSEHTRVNEVSDEVLPKKHAVR